MKVIKDIALTEPLVDTVESRAVVSNAVPILHLDILTCTKEVFNFHDFFICNAISNVLVFALRLFLLTPNLC